MDSFEMDPLGYWNKNEKTKVGYNALFWNCQNDTVLTSKLEDLKPFEILNKNEEIMKILKYLIRIGEYHSRGSIFLYRYFDKRKWNWIELKIG